MQDNLCMWAIIANVLRKAAVLKYYQVAGQPKLVVMLELIERSRCELVTHGFMEKRF